jgi:hypothetical protein
MRIPAHAIVPREKLTNYLLVSRPWDDKSKFLSRAGFTLNNPESLEAAIRELAANFDAVEDGDNDYGVFFRVEGPLNGPSGVALQVALIWLQWTVDGSVHFVTLKPNLVQP